ncbi:MAG: TolB family protein [Bacteroidia bacterium]
MRKYFVPVLYFLSVCLNAQITELKLFQKTGLDCSWDPSGSNLILYSKKGEDKFYDIYRSLPNGDKDTCVTCNHPLLPNKHIANMAWHPGGHWIIAVVEKAEHKGSSTDALPGFGAYCDIYVISKDGKKVHKILDEPNDYDHGIIAPRFSNDGKKVVWTERKKRPNILDPPRAFGYWVIKIAKLEWGKDSIPELKNIKSLEPNGDGFHECYGFSPNDNQLIFCSSMGEKSAWTQQIYLIDTTGNNLLKLTTEGYNEHGVFTPDGKRIVWMTNLYNKNKGTDWWIMNTDGTNKKRISFLNDKSNKQYEGHARWAGLVSFSPDGKKFVGGIQLSLITQEGKIVIGELRDENH